MHHKPLGRSILSFDTRGTMDVMASCAKPSIENPDKSGLGMEKVLEMVRE